MNEEEAASAGEDGGHAGGDGERASACFVEEGARGNKKRADDLGLPTENRVAAREGGAAEGGDAEGARNFRLRVNLHGDAGVLERVGTQTSLAQTREGFQTGICGVELDSRLGARRLHTNPVAPKLAHRNLHHCEAVAGRHRNNKRYRRELFARTEFFSLFYPFLFWDLFVFLGFFYVVFLVFSFHVCCFYSSYRKTKVVSTSN